MKWSGPIVINVILIIVVAAALVFNLHSRRWIAVETGEIYQCCDCGEIYGYRVETLKVRQYEAGRYKVVTYSDDSCPTCREPEAAFASRIANKTEDLLGQQMITFRDYEEALKEIDRRWEQGWTGNIRAGEVIDIVVIIQNFGKESAKGPFKIVVSADLLESDNPQKLKELTSTGFKICDEVPVSRRGDKLQASSYTIWRASSELMLKVRDDLRPGQQIPINLSTFQGDDLISYNVTFYPKVLGPD